MNDEKKRFYLTSLICLMSIVLACNVGGNPESTPEEQPTVTLESSPMPSDTAEIPTIPDGWLTYTSVEHCFEISYPPSFQALDDADSLYGWVNGVVLLYNGGQSYDIAVQAWDSQADLDANYSGPNFTIVPYTNCNGKIISVFDVTHEAESKEIMDTFTLLP